MTLIQKYQVLILNKELGYKGLTVILNLPNAHF